MQEWIVTQFERSLIELGIDKPWFWDDMLEEIDNQHHGMHLGVWFWRPTVWWNPAAGVSTAERAWLEEKYPGWNDTWGHCWDVITDNALDAKMDQTLPVTLPVVCNMCQLPINSTPGPTWTVRDFPLTHEGRDYHFCSKGCQWVFEQEPDRYKGHLSLVDRFLAGHIQPPDLGGALKYMGLSPGEMGEDALKFSWVEGIRAERLRKAG